MAKKVLMFSVGDRQYGAEVEKIQGIENYIPPTEVANVPEYVAGVVNIREDVYPVLNLRNKFGLPSADATEDTKYIILNTKAGKIACMVDCVIEIFVGEDKPFPAMLKTEGTEYASGIMKVHDNLVIIIEPEYLLTESEAKIMTEVASE